MPNLSTAQKQANYAAPDLIVDGVPSELKTQQTPYFKTNRDYGIDPQYAVSFNRGDYDLYIAEYPDLSIYFWVNWQELGIPVKVNIDSGGKPNGIPERR